MWSKALLDLTYKDPVEGLAKGTEGGKKAGVERKGGPLSTWD